MSVTRSFIRRPVATTLLMLALALCGALGLHFMPVAALPEVDFPTIEVLTLYPGGSPQVMEEMVTAPLERQFGQMPGLQQMSSSSGSGSSSITLQFSLQTGLDVAEQEVQEGINAAAVFLPKDLPMPPVYNKVNPGDAPIMSLAITATQGSMIRLEDLADNRLALPLSQVPGVGLVRLQGGQRPAVRLRARIDDLRAHGLSLEDVRNQILTANVAMAKGSLDGPQQASTLDANDQLMHAVDYRSLIIAYQQGHALRLSDVADVVDAAENVDQGAWLGQKPAILLSIQRQPGSNVLQTVAALKRRLQSLRNSLPADVRVQVVVDRTQAIWASIRDVSVELLFAIIFVILVIQLFLRSWSATLIPALAVPLSLLGSCALMQQAGLSINNLTLMAMTVATGFVVDDAIVMVENIARGIDEGLAPLQAALQGARQMAFTIVSLTLSLLAVLIPLVFMNDLIGRLFREFALTLGMTILISAAVSLSLTPMLAARLLRPASVAAVPIWWQTLLNLYARALDVVLRHRRWTMVGFVLSFILTVALYLIVPKGFFPQQDVGEIQGMTRADAGTSYAGMVTLQARLVQALAADPAVAQISSVLGVDGDNLVSDEGRIHIVLKPRSQRPEMAEVLRHLQERAARDPDLQLFLRPVQEMAVDDHFSAASYRLTLSDVDSQELRRSTAVLQQSLRRQGELTHVQEEAARQEPTLMLHLNRDAAARYGVTMAAVDNVLYDAFGQRMISTTFTPANQYRIILESADSSVRALQSLYVPGTAGPVPLSELIQVQPGVSPQRIDHQGQFPAASLAFDLRSGDALEAGRQAVRRAIAQAHLPVRVQVVEQGVLRAFSAALDHQLALLIAAILSMYIVLGILYESFRHPLTILSTLPSAALGALVVLIGRGQELDMLALIGIILLIGIVKKNAIMMIDFALVAEREQGLTPAAAIRQACLLRLRPILMTTLCALVGALPLLKGGHIGAELRQPLGWTLLGGLLVSQLLTLFTTPVLYLIWSGHRDDECAS